ncbi:MAG TPA: FAD-dependent monooxygenase [Pilimelia sp.]|nr:FAD-dependent monooxygenase [Pilimelia sp.]
MPEALVIGAGIAGPTAAMALQKVGVEATIYEAYGTTAHGVGGTIGLSTNGLDGLRALGAHEAVRSAGFPTSEVVTWIGRGRRVGSYDRGSALPDGTVSLTVRRTDLYAVLRTEALRRGIRIEHGKRLVGVEQCRDAVLARFADGDEAVGGILIGADGMRSRTRQLVDPNAPPPCYAGLVATGGCAATDLAPTPNALHLVFGRRAFFGYTVCDDGTAWWFANLRIAREPTPEALSAVSQREWRGRLLAAFAGDVPVAAHVVRATRHDLEFGPMHCMDPPARWHRSRMALIGDAAHVSSPTSAQGAALAIEDALVLARCVRDRDEPAAAFATFQRLRQRRVQRVVDAARRVNRRKAAGPLTRGIRHALMRVSARTARPDVDAWLYDHRIDFAAPVDWDRGGG